MKLPNNTVTLCAFALVTGCASKELKTQPVATQEPTTQVFVENGQVVTPGLYKAFYTGRTVDPKNGNIMYPSGDVYVRERSEQWNLSGTDTAVNAASVRYGPQLAQGSSAYHPQPVPAEYEQMLAKANVAMNSLIAQNQTLSEQVKDLSAQVAKQGQQPFAAVVPEEPESPVNNVVPHPPVEESASVSKDLTTADGKDFVTLVPNSDGVIEMDLAMFDSPNIGEANPFVQRYQQKSAGRSIEVRLTSLALGPNPSAVINDHLISLGNTFEGFTLWSIERDAVYLRRDAFLLNIPMQQKAVTIRIP